MAFYFTGNEEQKQYLNLSELALSIMEWDMQAFCVASVSGYINHIVLSFADSAESSISLTLENKLHEWERVFQSMGENEKKHAIECLQNDLLKTLNNRITSYPSGKGFRFRINNELLEYLTSEISCNEEKYYENNIGRYIKALMEEYSRKTYFEREGIYYKEQIDTLELAISQKKVLKLKLNNGEIIKIRGYKVGSDPLLTYHYLIGIISQGRSTRNIKNSYSVIRITNINSIKVLHASGTISETDKQKIEETIVTHGIQFIGNEAEKIVVKLTLNGVKKYNQIGYLRPIYTEKNKNIYTFRCTVDQARFYFYRFGKDAKVLSPQRLANQLMVAHQRAADIYKD